MDVKWTRSKKAPTCDNCGNQLSNALTSVGASIQVNLCRECLEDWVFQLFYMKPIQEAVIQAAVDVLKEKMSE
jgi:hypothetical protein